jgi:hypothetical protein
VVTTLMFIASMIAGVAVWVLFHALLGVGLVFGYSARRHPIVWSIGIFLDQAIAGWLIAMASRGPNLFLAGAALAKRSLPAAEQ